MSKYSQSRGLSSAIFISNSRHISELQNANLQCIFAHILDRYDKTSPVVSSTKKKRKKAEKIAQVSFQMLCLCFSYTNLHFIHCFMLLIFTYIYFNRIYEGLANYLNCIITNDKNTIRIEKYLNSIGNVRIMWFILIQRMQLPRDNCVWWFAVGFLQWVPM